MSTLTRLEAVTSSNIRLIGIEQEMMLGPRHARRKMGEDEVVPAIMSDQPVGGGEIDADLPFLGADLVLHRRDLDRRQRRAPRPCSAMLDASHRLGLMSAPLAVAAGATLSGWAAAKASSAFASASARTRVG